jgi:hypothetical protein
MIKLISLRATQLYDQELLDQQLTDGIKDDPYIAVATLKMIKEFSRL